MANSFEAFKKSQEAELLSGTTITTKLGYMLRVICKLGEGGQGAVYKVDYDGHPMALKWFATNRFYDRDLFISNLQRNIMAGSPTKQFLWPVDITHEFDGRFGYVMELAPKSFVEAGRVFLNPSLMPSYRRTISACLEIVQAFRILHDRGYRYQDMSGGNFFIEPSSGRVLICDNDNVAPEGVETGILGTDRFMAPEIVRHESLPTVRSDLYSMAVIVFSLILFGHPLEGAHIGALDDQNTLYLYGTHPLFVFDKHDSSNAPIKTPKKTM